MVVVLWAYCFFFFFKQKTAYEMRISDWSSDVCSSDLPVAGAGFDRRPGGFGFANRYEQPGRDIRKRPERFPAGMPAVHGGIEDAAGAIDEERAGDAVEGIKLRAEIDVGEFDVEPVIQLRDRIVPVGLGHEEILVLFDLALEIGRAHV